MMPNLKTGQSWGIGVVVTNYVLRVGGMFTRVGRLFAGVRLRLYTCIGNVSQKWVARNERINILTVMAYTFLLSDESVNSYGTRVLTAGIRLDDYEKNPVVLWNHTRAWSDREDQI